MPRKFQTKLPFENIIFREYSYSMNTKTKFGIGLVALAAVVLLVLNSPIFKQKQAEVEQTPTQSVDELLNGWSSALEIKPELRDSIYWDWVDGNSRLPLTGKQFLMGTVNINGIGQYKALADQSLENITFENMQPIITTSQSFLTGKGFSASPDNNRTTPDDGPISRYYGFENGDTKCLMRLDYQTDPFGTFFCGIIDKNQEQLQSQFRNLFSEDLDANQFTSFRVQKVEGDFATGAFIGVVTGYQWIAKQENGAWTIIWTGSEPPMCSEVEQYGIPKSIYQTCYTDTDGTMQ